MVEVFVANLASLLPFGYAFGAGMVTTVSPCGIAMLPAYVSLYLGEKEEGFWAKSSLIGHMVNLANQLAKREGISESGYRLVMNCGEQGGQLVPHLHLHLLGGRKLSDTLG